MNYKSLILKVGKRMIKGNIDSFETMGLVDGPGVRFVVFMQGCPLRCAYCHNPETWLDQTKIQMTPEELVKKILKYKTYFGDDGGVTFSGGEPLHQPEFLLEALKECKKNGINTCLDTSGFGDNYDEILDYCDLVILDVKELDAEKYKKLTGQPIDKFYAFLNKCQEKGVKMWFRQVILPHYNDTPESVLKLIDFASKCQNVEKVELLPYHSMAKEKYKKLGIKYRLENLEDMNKERCRELEKLLK